MRTEQIQESPVRARLQLILSGPDKKLEPFMDMFKFLDEKHYGKLTDKHFIIDTRARFEVKNELHRVFNELQDEARANGFTLNCYCFNI